MSAANKSVVHDEQRMRTQQYVQDHHIRDLFSYLTQAVVYHKPDNPREFIRDEIRKIRQCGVQSLFTEADVATMFEMIDVTKQGTISIEQLRNTCRNLAADSASGSSGEIDEKAIGSAADARGRVNLDNFRNVVYAQLATKSRWLQK